MRHSILLCVCAAISLTCSALFAGDPIELSKAIDRQIDAALQTDGIAPAPQAEDAELVRRLYLDVLGRIPTAEETQAYLEDPSGEKHHRLIDELLKHEEFPAYWSHVFDQWLNSDVRERGYGREKFLAYLEQALDENRPWDKIAWDLLLPKTEDELERGAAYFLHARLRNGDNQDKIDSMTTAVASVFFGVQLQCAKCHDHPYVDDWKQDHYYGLAAFVGRTQETKYKNDPFTKERADGEVTFVTTSQEEKTAEMMFLDGHVVDEPELPEDRDKWYTKGKDGRPDAPVFSRRKALAEYALNARTPYFKRAMVNRMWKHLMSRGLVEPVDQMHDANPATHPELLQLLADDFAENGFDLKRLMAAILHSDAYLRSSRYPGAMDADGDDVPRSTTYAVAILKPLSPAQLVTSVGIATGDYRQRVQKYEREKKRRKIDNLTPAVTRSLYLQERDSQRIAERFADGGEFFEANAAQAMFLAYNSLVMKQLEPRDGSFVERLSKLKSDEEAVRQAFLTVLSRYPEEDEVKSFAASLAGDDSSRARRCREMVWALLCSAEFRFNH